ncbi:hypothetical protein Aperf_G00000126536 [Anoplocephala perfoliata]
MSAKISQSKGDWVCSDSRCGNINFARRDKCYKCGRPKKGQGSYNSGKEVGKEFAEKSRGLFSPGDWECKGCGNVNWARRTACNVCNAPKINTQGQRTGYGGGYMERDEVVDYKRHDESDDEFDEFGLKKKKYRKTHAGDEAGGDKPISGASEKSEKHSDESVNNDEEVSQQEEEEEEDKEEESGDDEDLAKYDILGDDDEQAPDSNKNPINGDPKKSVRTSSASHSPSASSKTSSSDSDSDSTSSTSSDSESSLNESSSSEEGEKDKDQ